MNKMCCLLNNSYKEMTAIINHKGGFDFFGDGQTVIICQKTHIQQSPNTIAIHQQLLSTSMEQDHHLNLQIFYSQEASGEMNNRGN